MLRALLVVCVLGYGRVVEANDDCPDDGITYQTTYSTSKLSDIFGNYASSNSKVRAQLAKGTYQATLLSKTISISNTRGIVSASCNADDTTITFSSSVSVDLFSLTANAILSL